MMKVVKYQRGLSSSGWMTLLVVIGLIAWLGIKIIPIYIDNGKVSNAMENVKANGPASKGEVKSALLRRLSIDDVEIINSTNYNEFAKYERTGQGFILTIQYASEAHLTGDLYLTVKFDKTVEVP